MVLPLLPQVITDSPSEMTTWGPVGGGGLYISNQGAASFMVGGAFVGNIATNGAGILCWNNNQLQVAMTIFDSNIASLVSSFNLGIYFALQLSP